MTDILFRAELHNPEQARAILARQALPWVGAQLTIKRIRAALQGDDE